MPRRSTAASDGDGFAGADFRFLAANVSWRPRASTLFPPYAIQKFGNIKVGFIGMTLEGTPDDRLRRGHRRAEFLDEADTINTYARELRDEHGVRAIVVLLHEGGAPSTAPVRTASTTATCSAARSPTSSTGSTRRSRPVHHRPHAPAVHLQDRRPPRHERQRRSGGSITDIDLTLDRRIAGRHRGRAPTTASSRQRRARRDAATSRRSSPLPGRSPRRSRDRVIGGSPRPLTRAQDPSGESHAGDLIADAQLVGRRRDRRAGGVHEPRRRPRPDLDARPARSPTSERSRSSRSATRS